MKIRLREGLPFISAEIEYQGQRITLENTLLDTGSAGTVFSADELLSIGLEYEPEDIVRRIRGVGGSEFVFTKRIDLLAVGGLETRDFEIEVGAMDYGFEIDGIIGMDALTRIGIVIDLRLLELRAASRFSSEKTEAL
jgi:predicted aspartyl protease